MLIIPLASGSKGNSYLLESGHTRILVDAGLSAKQLSLRLASVDIEPSSVNAIFISHEHGDHIRGARVFSKKFRLPVYMNTACFETARVNYKLDELPDIRLFNTGHIFDYQDIMIHPLSISHDTRDPVCFSITDGKKNLGIITDLGKVSTLIHMHARRLDALILESNHDINMLKMNFRYPEKVKQRIRSNRGHLSNKQAAEFAADIIMKGKLRHLLLAHLSEENNNEKVCMEMFLQYFREKKIDLPFSFARQHTAGTRIIL